MGIFVSFAQGLPLWVSPWACLELGLLATKALLASHLLPVLGSHVDVQGTGSSSGRGVSK